MGILNDTKRASLTTADTALTTAEIHADAQRKLEIIRGFVAEFSDAENLAPLTSAQLRIASRTTPGYLRKGAVVADAEAVTGYPSAASTRMRIAADAEEAFRPVIVALADATRVMQISLARVKLDAAEVARTVRRVATTYSRTPQGAGLKETVEEMRAAQSRPARRAKKPVTKKKTAKPKPPSEE